MRLVRLIHCALPLAIAATAAVAGAQGKGQGKGGDDKGKGKAGSSVVRQRGNSSDKNEHPGQGRSIAKRDDDNARGRGNAVVNRGNDKRGDDRVRVMTESGGNVDLREFVTSDRKGRRLAGLAVVSAARGGRGDDFRVTPVGDRVQVLNRDGVVLVDFEDDRELGNWPVVTQPFRDKRGAPSFCRSGAGHPVWGRQWCVEKGFGLGSDGNYRWSRVLDPSNVVLTRPSTTSDLTRAVLMDVLGSVVLNRLATHAVTLGYQDPLAGRWIGEPGDRGPRVLLVSSGTRPVAEMVDVNRDGRADLMLVSVR